ncbi:MAG: cadherin-like domain-containing protein [Akkermansiaceae bacterium]|nr:cadherin-like domain-containing protein [Akkermansiaceae bacterium]
MKLNPRALGATPRYLAASLLLSLLPLTGQTITNPSFSDNDFTISPGYASLNGGVINGWTLSNPARIGQNKVGIAAFADNGTIPTAPNVLFIQAGASGTANVKTTVTGLTPDTKYNVSFRVNARAGQAPKLVFSTDGTGPIVATDEIASVGGTNAYKYVGFEFTATATSHQITIANTRTDGDHTLLVDDVTITPSSGAWSIAPWTGDADSGVDPQYVYTHAQNFSVGAWQSVNINGVDFDLGDSAGSNRFTLAGYNSNFTNRTPNNVTGESAKLAKDFRYDGTGITLQNLKPLTEYVCTVYGIAFDGTGSRSATFGSSLSSEKLSVNLNQYGQGNGIRVIFTYTTDESATPVSISLPALGAGTFHTSGFSNREAVASTPPVVWTAHQWTDDATSGVSASHPYTHAFKFGSATNLNLNGINFTGIAGPNPSGANYTSAGLGNVYNNDTNVITTAGPEGAGGAILGRDFLYGGYPETHYLTGLTPGKNYVFTLYTVGWTDGIRRAALIGGTGEGASILNQDEFGPDQGVRFEYEYTASAAGTATITASGLDVSVIAPFDRKGIHTYGISNREADPYVAKAPEFTLQPLGATLGMGASYILRGATIGSSTMTYQWKKGNLDIPGETTPVLVLYEVTAADSGAYTLVVSNGTGGPIISNTANLTVLENVPAYGNTGLGVDGQLLAGGQIDPHFKLITNPDNTSSETVFVQTALPGSWLANSSTSLWIGPRADSAGSAGISADAGAGPGVYVYRTSLDLTGFDLATVVISGKWSSDNEGIEIRVNGTAIGFPNTVGTTFATLVPFNINNTAFPALLTDGVNTVDFVVKNTDATAGYTGLRIDGFAAIGTIPPGTPPHIVIQPLGANGTHYSTVALSVGASGSAPLTYQWFNGTDPVLDATEPELLLYIDDLTWAGTYKVRVTNGVTFVDSEPAEVTVTNANPATVFDDAGTTDQDVPLDIEVFELLANDSDPDGDFLEFTSVSPTSTQGGTVTESLGLITYTPAPGYSGVDSFSYTVNDGIWGGSSVETVVVTVIAVANTPPGQMTLVLSGGVATGTFTGTPGETYLLERSTTLEPDSWSTIDTKIAPVSGAVVVEDPSPPVGRAFYRLSYTP